MKEKKTVFKQLVSTSESIKQNFEKKLVPSLHSVHFNSKMCELTWPNSNQNYTVSIL